MKYTQRFLKRISRSNLMKDPYFTFSLFWQKNDKGALKTFKCNKKTHSTMKKESIFTALCRAFTSFNNQGRLVSSKNICALYF